MSHHHSCEHEATDVYNALETGIQYSLYEKIDMQNLECLNEEIENSGRLVFKPYENRLDFDKFVNSDADAELLFNIPFTGNIKLKGFRLIGADDGTHPNKIRLYKNRPRMTFDDVTIPADQEFDLNKDTNGLIEYATKVVAFSSVYHLTLHIPSNFGSDSTKVYYIGLKGEFSETQGHKVTICNYEVKPNISDHKNDLFDKVNHHVQ